MNKCKIDSSFDNFNADFEDLTLPLVMDNLSLKNSEGEQLEANEATRKKFLANVVAYLGSKYDIKNSQIPKLIGNILEEQEFLFGDKMLAPYSLTEHDVRQALNTKYTGQESDLTTIDYTTKHLEKDDDSSSRQSRYNTGYLTKYFGKCTTAQNYCKTLSTQLAIDSCILSIDAQGKARIVKNDNEVNENIRNKQEELYQNIYKYLEKRFANNPDKLKDLPKSMYMADQITYLDSFEKLNTLFGDIFNTNSFNENTLNEYFIDLNRASKGSPVYNQAFLPINAYTSWVILKNFEKVLKNTFGNSLFINKTLPKFTPEIVGSTDKLKYSLSKAKASNMNQTWRTTEDINISEEVSNLVQMLVTNVKYLGSDRNITFNEFGYIVGKIKDIPLNFNYSGGEQTFGQIFRSIKDLTLNDQTINDIAGLTYRGLLAKVKQNPQRYLPELFEVLSNDSMLTSLFQVKAGNHNLLNSFDKTLIKSLYRGLFDRNNISSLMYASNQNGYITQNYMSYLTEVGDGITNCKYLQYFRDIDGEVYVRNMYDQTLNNIIRTIEDSILVHNTRKMSIYDKFKQDLNISELYSDADNGTKTISSIKFQIPHEGKEKLFLNAGVDGRIYITDGIGNGVETVPESYVDDVRSLADQVLHQGYSTDSNLWENFLIQENGDNIAASKDLLTVIGTVLLNERVSSVDLQEVKGARISADYTGTDATPIRNFKKVKESLNSIYGNTSSLIPKYNMRLGEIYLTNNHIYPIMYKMAQAKAQTEGRLTASQIKDGSGNAVANNTLSRLLGNVLSQWELQGRQNNSTVKDFQLLKAGVLTGIYQAREFKDSVNTTSTAHTEFSPAETEESEITYDFLQGLATQNNANRPVGNGTVAFLPTDNSDKSYIGRIAINLNNVNAHVYINGTEYDRSLYDLIWNKTTNEPTPYANEVMDQVITSEFGSGNGYYTKVRNAITNTWNKVNTALQEYVQPTDPYYNAEGNYINYQQSQFDAINSKYSQALQNGLNPKTPYQLVSDAVRMWNNNHPNDIITLTEHTTYEIDKRTNFLIPNIDILGMAIKFNDPQSTKLYFDIQNVKLTADLLKDGFKGLPYIATVTDISGKTIQLTDTNSLYGNLGVITTLKNYDVNTSADVIIQDLANAKRLHINPILSLYNKLNYLFTQEWITSTVGGQFNHPSKVKNLDMDLFRTTPLNENELNNEALAAKVQLAQLLRNSNYNLTEFRKQASAVTDSWSIENYIAKIHDALTLDEAGRFTSQTKRNVSYTAAMHPFQLGCLQGIPTESNICVIKDNLANIATLTGIDDKVPTSDGATFVNPWMAYWENGSLGAEKVGINKKQFIHFYDATTGSGGIIKTAGFSMTNELMRRSIFQRRMTQLMTNRPYLDRNGNRLNITDYDLTTDYYGNKIILSNNNDIDGNFYIKRSDGSYAKFVDLVRNADGTYTRRIQMFDPDSMTTTSNTIDDTEFTNQIIDSNYRLWQAFGGYDCYEQKSGMDNLTGSEFSIKAVADTANKASVEHYNKNNYLVSTQEDVYQFMKHSDLHYMPTEGAVKHGAANSEDINTYLKDDTQIGDFHPNFMHINMYQSGIQLDKEHNADQEDLSIFTQVLSACAARGYSRKTAQKLYNALASLANNAVAQYQEAFDQYIESPLGKEDFQRVTADLIAKALLNQNNTSDVLNYVASNLMQLAKEGREIKFKDNIPFSDSSIYNKLISTISTTLTKSAIKVKMPGLLAVLCPSYDIIKLYNGRFLDQYKSGELEQLQAKADANPIWTNGTFVGNSDIELCTTYKVITDTPDISTNLINFYGSDAKQRDGYVDVLVQTPAQRLKLKQFLNDNNLNIQSVVENIQAGRNLAPYDVKFTATNSNGVTQNFSLYDCDLIKQRFEDKASVSDDQLQTVLNAVSTRYGNTNYAVTINGESWTIDKNSIKIKPFEIVMPKVFATNFGLDVNSNLSEISANNNYFVQKILSQYKSHIDESYFNLAFNKMSGDPIYVLDRANAKQSENFYPVDIEQEVDSDGTVKLINNDYDVDLTLSKNQNALDNDSTLKQDEVWQYIDNNGYVHNVIVTDDLNHWAKSVDSNSIYISTKYNTDKVENALKQGNKVSKEWYNAIEDYITYNNNLESNKTQPITFANGVRSLQEVLNNYDGVNAPQEYSIGNIQANNKIIQHIQDEGHAIWTSFKKSLDIVAARIPAQSLQSVMAMKIAGFIDSDINTAYVSTLQTYLQGSDYDIDAVSLAMYGFDKSGKFIQWSDRFNMDSVPMLEASLDLPFPTGKQILPGEIKYSNDGIDLNDYFSTSEHPDPSKPFVLAFANGRTFMRTALNTPEAIRNYGEFIEQFSQNPTFKQGNTLQKQANIEKFAQLLRKEVNNYNSYINKMDNSRRKEEAIKNYIQNCIYNITVDPINQNEAQNSVDFTVGPFKKLAAASPKAQEAIRNTPGAFTSTIYAINTNAVGKKGIGIAAVGLKSYFALTQYWNNVLEYGTKQEKEQLPFNVTIDGQTYHTLTNIHCENPDQFADEVIKQAKNDSDYALQLSAILSLATDNAKELALSKLNCDTNTMGMWLYGLTIGVPFTTMAKIMTSNIGFQISSMLYGNMFTNTPSQSMNRIFSYIDNGPDDIATTENPQDIFDYYSGLGIDLNAENYPDIINIVKDNSYGIADIQNAIEILEANKKLQGVNINSINQTQTWLRIRALLKQDSNIYEDFKTLAKGADELKTLGQILHLNQGLYTSDTDTLKLVNKIENLISDRRYAITENKRNYREDPSDSIDLHRFIYDKNYQQAKISKYDSVAKVSFNILNVLVQNPHYFSYLKMLDLQNNMNSAISAKYRTISTLGQEKIEDYRAHAEEDKESILKRTAQFVDNYIINTWLRETGETGINIMIPKGATIYTNAGWDFMDTKKARLGLEFSTPTGTSKVSETGISINLGTENGRATFKRWMEDIVIPNLQKGNLGERDSRGAYRPNKNSPILDNKFITGLTPVIFSNTPMKTTITGYSLGINMSPRSDSDIEIFDMYKHEFNKLREDGYKYKVGTIGSPEYQEYDLTDLFFLYNLITFQNRLGETSLTRIFEDSRDQGIIPSYYEYINNIDRNSDIIIPTNQFNSPEVDAQLAPVANPRTTHLKKFLHIDGTTGKVAIYTKRSAREMQEIQAQNPEESVSNFATNFVTESNYYPVRDVPNTNYKISSDNANNTFNKDVSLENRQFVDRQGAVQQLTSIEVNHNMGSINSITVNGQQINFNDSLYSPYKKYFKHVPTKTIFLPDGGTTRVYDYKKLNDDIITLISQVC